jgi:putative transposase
MKKNTEPLQPETFYHVYNRGINGEVIFTEERNYAYFLQQYDTYISLISDTYSYCLLNNHFHFLIKTKSESQILQAFEKVIQDKTTEDVKSATFHLQNQFAKLFNSYTQSINNANNRTGGLFERPFRRINVENDSYLSQLIWYIHFNPQKHGVIRDFRSYHHSSYHSHLSIKPTKLKRDEILAWFGGRKRYIGFHDQQHDESELQKWLIEF